jgi:murein DD-endopeptidase MepM/ murein hydrolase activator NlpD
MAYYDTNSYSSQSTYDQLANRYNKQNALKNAAVSGITTAITSPSLLGKTIGALGSAASSYLDNINQKNRTITQGSNFLPTTGYNTTSNRGSTSKKTDGEPGYMACRGATGGTYCNRGHKGIDIYGSFGTPILAPESGTIVEYGGSDVTNSRESAAGGRGRWLYLKADGGKYYVFMHTEGFSDAVLKGLGLSKQIGETSATKANFKVKAGDTIAYIGNTGGIQNPHLHLGVYTDAAMSNSEDPTSILGGASSDIPTTDASGCPTTNSGNDGTIVSTACSFEKSVRDAGCVDKSECLIEKLYNAVRVKTFTDCWGFAATILKITVDPKVQYGMQAHDAAKEYFDLHPEKYQVIRGITDPKQLKPGDILVRESGGSHVSVFVGDKGCGCPKNVVSASYPTHGPQCSNWYGAMSTAVRLK